MAVTYVDYRSVPASRGESMKMLVFCFADFVCKTSHVLSCTPWPMVQLPVGKYIGNCYECIINFSIGTKHLLFQVILSIYCVVGVGHLRDP